MDKEYAYIIFVAGWIVGFMTCVLLAQFFPIVQFL